MTIAKTVTSTDEREHEKKVEIDFFHIDMIPDAMDKMNWHTAAQLMRHWFSIKPAFAFTDKIKNELLKMDADLIYPSQINSDIVKMSWAIEYKQVKEGVETLSKVWNSPKGRAELKVKLGKAGNYEKEKVEIGYENDVKKLDSAAQVNYLIVGGMLDAIDGWYGAMGTSNLKVCVRGGTECSQGRYYFHVEKLGFYLKDTYDFLDDASVSEPLGIWSEEKVLNKLESAAYLSSYTSGLWGVLVRNYSGFVPIFNVDFRKWQSKHNSGGDFIVFSDVLWIDALPKDRKIEI